MSSTLHTQRWTRLRFGEHQLRYSVVGQGPAVVFPKKDIGDYAPTRLLADRYTLIQVEPLGFCCSDRPQEYLPGVVPEQILAVCDAQGIDDFAIWGFSQGGAMACTIARATPRARLLVCGGFNPLRGLSNAWLARMNREKRIPLGSREFWNYFHATTGTTSSVASTCRCSSTQEPSTSNALDTTNSSSFALSASMSSPSTGAGTRTAVWAIWTVPPQPPSRIG